MLVHSDVFERFTQGDTIPVMAQAAMENALSPRIIDQLFEDVAQRQYTRDLLFSSIVELMSVVVCRIQPSINAAYQKKAVPISVSLQALYRKIDRIETPIASALVRKSDERLAPVIIAMGGTLTPFLPGYRTKILDGNHLPGTEHRIQELRTMRAGALPGHALVVFDPERMLAIDAILCEDGHAQERSLFDQVLQTVAARDLWIADRNFCTTDFLFGIVHRDGSFVIRQHASTLHYTLVGKRKARGRIETGAVFEQRLRATNEAGEILFLRRVSVVLDEPTRDGDTEIHLLTNLPAKGVHAEVVADLYRRRWTIETAFQELEATLGGEISTLGYPKAALFAFCVALVSYNVLSTVKAALRGARGRSDHRGVLGVLPRGRGEDELPRDDEGDPEGRVGGIPGDVPGGVGRSPGLLGTDGAPVGVPQESPRPEETEAQEDQWGEGQTCRDSEDIKIPKIVHNITGLEGWLLDLAVVAIGLNEADILVD